MPERTIESPRKYVPGYWRCLKCAFTSEFPKATIEDRPSCPNCKDQDKKMVQQRWEHAGPEIMRILNERTAESKIIEEQASRERDCAARAAASIDLLERMLKEEQVNHRKTIEAQAIVIEALRQGSTARGKEISDSEMEVKVIESLLDLAKQESLRNMRWRVFWMWATLILLTGDMAMLGLISSAYGWTWGF